MARSQSTILFLPRLRGALLLGGVALALLIFGLLAEDVMERELIGFDLPLLAWLRQRASAPLDAVMIAITWAGSAWVVVPAAAAVLWAQRAAPARARFWLVANGGAALINVLCKRGRNRMVDCERAMAVPGSGKATA